MIIGFIKEVSKSMGFVPLVGIVAITISGLTSNAWGQTFRMDRLSSVKELVDRQVKRYGANRVLVAVDIDHTLLTPYTDLGSSYWYYWQSDLLKTPEQEAFQLALDSTEFTRINERAMELLPFRPVEPTTQEIWNDLVDTLPHLMIVTARGPSHRPATKREFEKNGLKLPKRPPGRSLGEPMVFSSEAQGGRLARSVLEKWVPKPRPVTYEDGILMLQGQHKGAALLALLNRFNLRHRYRALVFVDDGDRNCRAVDEAFASAKGLEVTSILYTFDHPRFERFGELEKFSVTLEAQRLGLLRQ